MSLSDSIQSIRKLKPFLDAMEEVLAVADQLQSAQSTIDGSIARVASARSDLESLTQETSALEAIAKQAAADARASAAKGDAAIEEARSKADTIIAKAKASAAEIAQQTAAKATKVAEASIAESKAVHEGAAKARTELAELNAKIAEARSFIAKMKV